MRIALLEQDIVGGGASGRNGGFASSSWFDAAAIIALFGEQEGVRYLRVSERGRRTARRVRGGTRDRLLVPPRGRPRRADRRVAGRLRHRWAGVGPRALRRGRRSEGPHGARKPARTRTHRGSSKARSSSDNAIVQPARLARGLRRAAPRARRPHLRAHADALARASHGRRSCGPSTARCAPTAWCSTTGAWAADIAAVPPELRRDRRLRRGHRADPRSARPRSGGRARSGSPTGASGSTTCARPTTAGS